MANDKSGALIDQVFFSSTIVASLVIAYLRRMNWRKVFAANAALMLYFVYFTISVCWSDYPVGTLIRIAKDFGATVIVITVILSEAKPLEAIRAVYVRCACVMIPLSAVLIRVSPLGKQYSRNGEISYRGAALQKNSLGELLLICIMLLVWDHMEARLAAGAKRLWSGMQWDRVLLVVVGVWLMHLSESKTSLVSLIIGLALILRTGWLASRKVSRLVFGAALAYPLLVLCGQKASLFSPILEMLGRDATFTGRADIWQHITFDTVNPLLGAGFWNFWGGPGGQMVAAAMKITAIPNAHDGYLDIYLDGGLIGVFLLSCVLVTCGNRLVKRLPLDRYNLLRLALLIIAIIHNVTESSFSRLSGLWFTTVLALMEFPFLKSRTGAAVSKMTNGLRDTAQRLGGR